MAKTKVNNKKVRGGYVFQNVDLYADQPEMIQRYINKNGGTKVSVIRLALDLLLRAEYSE
jgi:hypothetical protein